MTYRARTPIINTALLVGTIVLFFSILEIAVRLTGIVTLTPQPPQIYERHLNPAIGYALKPNAKEKAYRTTVTTNSLGLRGPEIDPSKPLMAVVGDSITFGYGVEDNESLPARLQEKFPDWSVVNGGVPGYTIGQESTLYSERIAPLDPKLLVLVFYFNDLGDLRPPVLDDQGILREPGYTETGAPPCTPITEGILQYVPGQCWLNRHSAFFVGVRKFLSAKQEHRNLAAQEEEYRQTAGTDRVPQEQLDAYAAAFDQFAKMLPADLPRLFVIWPEKRVHQYERPVLKAMAEAQGFTVLDLYDTFGNTPKSLSWDTVHPAPETIAKAADVIMTTLDYFHLVPQP